METKPERKVMKGLKVFNLDINPNDVILVAVPTEEEAKLMDTKIILTPEIKKRMAKERQERGENASRPFVIAALGSEVKKEGKYERGDFVFTNPDVAQEWTIVKYGSGDILWENAIIAPSFRIVARVPYREEFETEFEKIIEDYNKKQEEKLAKLSS